MFLGYNQMLRSSLMTDSADLKVNLLGWVATTSLTELSRLFLDFSLLYTFGFHP